MAVINFSTFSGRFPKLAERKMPEGGAVIANDLIARGGKIEPIKGTSVIKVVDLSPALSCLYSDTRQACGSSLCATWILSASL